MKQNNLNEVEKELQNIEISTKKINDNLYNILTKEQYRSYSTWMVSVGFSINGVEIVQLIKGICKKYNNKIEVLENKKVQPHSLMANDLMAFFTNNPNKNIKKELEEEYKKTIGNDKINTLLFS